MLEVVGMLKQWGCKGVAGHVRTRSIVVESPK